MWFFLDSSSFTRARGTLCRCVVVASSETSPTCNFRKRWSKNLIFLRLDPSAVVVVAVYAQLKVTFIWATTIAHPQHTLSLFGRFCCAVVRLNRLYGFCQNCFIRLFLSSSWRETSRERLCKHTHDSSIFFFRVNSPRFFDLLLRWCLLNLSSDPNKRVWSVES